MPVRRRLLGAVVACAAVCAGGTVAVADVQFLGSAVIDGRGPDASGLTGLHEDGSREDALDGFGSGIAYTGYANRYVMLCDRGSTFVKYDGGEWVDYSLSLKCRFQVFDIAVTPSGSGTYQVMPSFVGTSLLRDEAGRNFVGLSSQFASADPTSNLRLDPESVRVAPDGTVYVSDEYGPNVYHFDASGRRLGALVVPEKFKVANPNALSFLETQGNVRGRVANKGMEGLAITPDGRYLLGAMQAPLIQDGGDNTRLTRMLLFDTTRPGDRPKEFLYKLNESIPDLNISKTGVSDVVAINDHQFVVDERDGQANVTKHAYTIDITGATDISGIESLSALSPAELDAIVPVGKSAAPLIDLRDLTLGKLDEVPPGYEPGFPDKIEGLAFGPDLPDGRHLLLVTNDDDFRGATVAGGYPNLVMAFAIDPEDLPDFEAEQFEGQSPFVPEPGGLAGLGLMFVWSRRRR
jgi:hypothetical protein